MAAPVPSRSLLRFLRTQSETAFFAAAPSSLRGVRASSGARLCARVRTYTTDAQKCTATSSPETAANQQQQQTIALEASLWPFGRPPQKQPQPQHAQQIKTAEREFSSSQAPAGWYKRPTGERNDPASTWQERLWGLAARRGAKPLKPDDLPGHDDFEHGSMFNSRRVMTAKAAAEPRLRCTEVDENGQVILVDGEFKKSELIAKVRDVPIPFDKMDGIWG